MLLTAKKLLVAKIGGHRPILAAVVMNGLHKTRVRLFKLKGLCCTHSHMILDHIRRIGAPKRAMWAQINEPLEMMLKNVTFSMSDFAEPAKETTRMTNLIMMLNNIKK